MENFDNHMSNGEVSVPGESFDKKSGRYTDPNVQPTEVDTDAGSVPNQWTNSEPISRWDLRKEGHELITSTKALNFEDFLRSVDEHLDAEYTGDCFSSSWDYLSKNGYKNPELRLVHGYVSGQGQLHGYRFAHGWCEGDEYVYDNANGKVRKLPKMVYYSIGNIRQEECKYYDYYEAMEMGSEYKFAGPWEIENTHYPEDWNTTNESDHDWTPAIHYVTNERIGITDQFGTELTDGTVIKHNENLYVIKWSSNRREYVARKEPLSGQGMSWRDLDWVRRCRPFISVVGNILFNHDLFNRFKAVLDKSTVRSAKINNKKRKRHYEQ